MSYAIRTFPNTFHLVVDSQDARHKEPKSKKEEGGKKKEKEKRSRLANNVRAHGSRENEIETIKVQEGGGQGSPCF